MSEHLERIDDFVMTTKKSQTCFILSSDNGVLIGESQFQSARDVVLIWSDSATASQQAKEAWHSFDVTTLDFEDLIDLLSHLSDDDMLVGVELTDEQVATEIEAADLLKRLS